jgi:asparagine synthetase B (glutamine-hydrolysing)
MCSVLITNRKIHNFEQVNYYLQFRGPDHTSQVEINGITFVHNLLSISGAFTPQPFQDQDIVAMHNGEIYNYGSYPSDGYLLIPTYLQHGEVFTQQFDGEFAVVLVDFRDNQLIFSTDIFRTKPLWYAINGSEFGISTYRTPLERLGFHSVKPVPANTIMSINLVNMALRTVGQVYEFELEQHKDSFADWTQAFENSIRKRTERLRERIFIGLSSGYDSGAIACELDRQNVDYAAYTVLGKEPTAIVDQRRRNNHRYITPTQEIYNLAHQFIVDAAESFRYTISSSSSDYNEFGLNLQDDSGSNGLSMVCALAKSDGHKIYLSGMGADEIFSDYGYGGKKIYAHSNFGGLFPEDIASIFPWNSFYGSSMESYLAKEEYVSGAYGIEGRYPFLDRAVVQEFLWLTADLKNSAYKSVLNNYLKYHRYPFVPNQKIGF